MSSNINPYNIDGTFPVAGQNNSSQGFRDNFTNIKNNFTYAEAEISDLQAKALTISALNGQQLGNDMAGTQIIRPQLASWTQTLFDNQTTEGTLILNFDQGNFQKLTTLGPVSLQFANWPSSVGAGALGYGSMRVWVVVTDVAHTLTLPSSVSIGDSDLAGFDSTTRAITFDVPGNYVFDFSSIDGGQNFLVFDLTRNRVQFRDPSFYYNDTVSPTFLIGFNQETIELAIALATNNDTLQVHGSQTNYVGTLENGNDYGLYGIYSNNFPETNANANIAGYSVGTSRAYINPETGMPVTDVTALSQPGDIIGYVNFIGPTVNPLVLPTIDVAIAEYGTIRSFVTGLNGNVELDPSLGGNLWFGTKGDFAVTNTPFLKPAFSLENDQSGNFYGNLILSNTGNSGYTSSYVPAHNTSAGTTGQVAWDQSYFYVCVSTNSWKRIALPSTTW